MFSFLKASPPAEQKVEASRVQSIVNCVGRYLPACLSAMLRII